MKKSSKFLMQEIGKKGVPSTKLQNILLPHGSFFEDMEDDFSMLAFMCGMDFNEMVHASQ